MKVKIILTGIVAITWLMACKPDSFKEKQIEAFIVVGAGNGIPLAGREIVGLDDSFQAKIASLKIDYDKEVKLLIEETFENDPSLRKSFDKHQAYVNENLEQIRSFNLKKKEVAASTADDFKNVVKERKAPLLEKKNFLKADLIHIEVIQKELNFKKDKLFNQIILKKEQIRENKAFINEKGKRLSLIIKAYILDNGLTDREPSEIINVTPASKYFTGMYKVKNPNTTNISQEYYHLDNVSLRVGKKLSNKIDPIVFDIIKKHEMNTFLDDEIHDLELKMYESEVAIESKYSGDEKLLQYSKYEGSRNIESFDERLKVCLKVINQLLNLVQNELKELTDLGYIDKLKAEKMEEIDWEIKLRNELTELYEETFRANLELHMVDKMTILEAKYLELIYMVFSSSEIFSVYTGADGTAIIPSNSSFLYFRASRLKDEKYSWLIKTQPGTDKQIISNHNITYDSTVLGLWVFDVFNNTI
ncbi:hypothetical protein [Thalassotalea aquiviva]|uniref:hypothetical protein n=1 Tax=Thalassotalea aquiviva TaxID=3242415 RepID=UPI00352ACAAB